MFPFGLLPAYKNGSTQKLDEQFNLTKQLKEDEGQ
jgi:hypothetical protein